MGLELGFTPFLMVGLLSLLAYAIYDMVKPVNVEQEIAELVEQGEKNENYLLAELRSTTLTTRICFLAGWLLTARYAVTFFSGSDLRYMLEWTSIEWSGAGIGLVVTTAITAVQYILYSSVKTRKSGMAVTVGILIFIVFSEVSGPMESEDMKMRTRSENSPVLQGIISGISNLGNSSGSAYASSIANAQAELAKDQEMLSSCTQRYKSAKSRSHCRHKNQQEIAQDKARIASLQNQQKGETSNNKNTVKTLIAAANNQQKNEDNHSAIIKFFMLLTGSAALAASALASLITVVAFEVAFHFSGSRRAVLIAALMDLESESIVYIEQAKQLKKAQKFKDKANQYRRDELTNTPAGASTSNLVEQQPAKPKSKLRENFDKNAGHPAQASKAITETIADAMANKQQTKPKAESTPAAKPNLEKNKKLMEIALHSKFTAVTTGVLDGSLPSQNQITKLNGVSSHPARAMITLLYALDYVRKNSNGTFSLPSGTADTASAKETAHGIQNYVKGELEKLT